MIKKGISPLIGSVLLIGFVIVLFIGITSFTQKDILEETVSKSEEGFAKQLACSEVSIDVVSACVDSLTSATKVKLNVDNIGSASIKDLSIRILGNSGDVGTADYNGASLIASPGRILSASNELTLSVSVANVDKVEVFPKNNAGDVCLSQLNSYSNVRIC